jgi:hypothetical protein
MAAGMGNGSEHVAPTTSQRLPWSMRTLKWIWIPMVILPWVPMAIWAQRAVFGGRPRDVPSDVCALVPADLLARVVPAGKVANVTAQNDGAPTNKAECTVATDRDQATTTARATLSISLTRHGDTTLRTSEDHSQHDFALFKRMRMANESRTRYHVFDLSKLGDSAYLAVEEPTQSQRDEQNSRVEVSVLRNDIELTVRYFASPTDDALSSSATVAVARALMDALK